MKQKIYRLFAFMMVLALVVTPVSANQISDDVDTVAEPERLSPLTANFLAVSETGLYFVQLAEPSLARYSGDISGLAATSPAVTGARKLDVSAPASVAYLSYLEGKQSDFIAQMNASLGRSVEVPFQYFNVLNALAVAVSHEEAIALVELPGVAAVYADTIRELETDVGPTLIGAPTFWDGEYGFGEHRGEGVIVGMLDTGVNPFHQSFAAVDGDGYVHENPYGSGNYVGVCDPDNPEQEYDDICNDKLIGAWSFISGPNSGDSARDWNDHGSHTGSTIAGNKHDATFTVGSDEFTRTISGVAPRANVISYMVCDPSCPGSSSVAAVNQAIADGTDVLNYSISGGDSPWTDPVDLAFLDGYAAGIFISASAGNDGPGPGTVAKTGPWNASVAASTHNRVIANTVDVTAPTQPPELQGLAAVPGTGPAIMADIVAEIRWSEDVDPGNIRGCDPFPAGAFSGAIALIQRGDCTFELKVTNATAAGAVAAIIYNHVGGPPIVMGGLEGTTIESVFIDKNDGDALAAFISASPDPVDARINEATSVIVNDAWQDVMAGFSS
ncbi:MAG: S8 family serine peptidase, partial [Anaerolineales bacterium]|nr:S8 family serine peptidase [Anaerolineales bacterium]